MEGSETLEMSGLLENAGLIVTESLTWVGEVASTITSNPLLLIFVLLGLVGLGIGLIRRII